MKKLLLFLMIGAGALMMNSCAPCGYYGYSSIGYTTTTPRYYASSRTTSYCAPSSRSRYIQSSPRYYPPQRTISRSYCSSSSSRSISNPPRTVYIPNPGYRVSNGHHSTRMHRRHY